MELRDSIGAIEGGRGEATDCVLAMEAVEPPTDTIDNDGKRGVKPADSGTGSEVRLTLASEDGIAAERVSKVP